MATNALFKDNLLDKILALFEGNDAISYIHLKGNCPIYIRQLGKIEKVADVVISNSDIIDSLKPIMNEKLTEDFEKYKQIDFSLESSSMKRYRANLYSIKSGYGLALRLINDDCINLDEMLPQFKDMNVSSTFKQICSLDKGLVIVCGPTGSGKSTTLSAMINYINHNFKKHIITVEDPIELIYKDEKSLINQREIGTDAVSFSLALKSALREDPDVILLGELRDAETIKEALTAAETGHLVLCTLHTQSTTKSIDRILDGCMSAEKDLIRSMLATSLQAVISQRLLKHIDGKKRIATYEILLASPAVRNLIKENKTMQLKSVLETSRSKNMVSMEQYTEYLFENGYINDNVRNFAISNLKEEESDD